MHAIAYISKACYWNSHKIHFSVFELAQELYTAYQKETFREGYMDNAMTAISASVCGMNLEIEELAGDRYLVTHTVRLK